MIMKGSACAHEQVMRKKAKASAKGGRGGAPKMLTKLEPVPSFFNFFSPPQVWHKCCASADVDSVLAGALDTHHCSSAEAEFMRVAVELLDVLATKLSALEASLCTHVWLVCTVAINTLHLRPCDQRP